MTTAADNKSSVSSSGPDIRQLAERELPKGSFPGEGRIDFRIALDEKVHQEIQKHAKENKQVEICGVLVGKWGRDDKGPFVAISASIRGEAATNKFAEVTFTHDTWSKINAEMDKNHPTERIVGWYHTHPDFGIFLSDRDRFIHENFFSEPGQVAYVVDPVRDIEGFFIWQGGNPVPAPYYWTGDQIRMAPAEKDPRLTSMRDEKRAGASSSERGREDDGPADGGAIGWLTLALGGMCLFMLGFMVNGWWVSSQVQRIFEAVTAQQQMDKVRVNEQLTLVASQLQEESSRLESQARAQTSMSDADRQILSKALFDMRATALGLEQMSRQFGISAGDLAHVSALIDRTQLAMDAMRNATTQASSTIAGSGSPGSNTTAPTAMPETTMTPLLPTTAPSK